DAEAEDETPAARLLERLGRHAHRLRIVAPDPHDAGSQVDLARRAGKQAEQRERFAAHRLRHPERAESERLGSPGIVPGTLDVKRVEVAPDPQSPEVGATHPMPRSDNAGTARPRTYAH